MKGIKAGIKRGIKFLQISCVTLLLSGSYTSLAQSQPDNLNVLDSLNNAMHDQVNINLADAETIAAVLDGIGLSRAEAIVDYRGSNGDFKSIEDLIMVSGIGEITVRNNADKILLSSD